MAFMKRKGGAIDNSTRTRGISQGSQEAEPPCLNLQSLNFLVCEMGIRTPVLLSQGGCENQVTTYYIIKCSVKKKVTIHEASVSTDF